MLTARTLLFVACLIGIGSHWAQAGHTDNSLELDSRDWKDIIANELDLEGCEVDAFKDVVDKGIELLKKQLGKLADQVITKIKQGKRGVEDEWMMVNERGWVELVTKPIGLDSCQAGALKKFLTWFLRKGEQLGIPGFAQANVALQQMDKVDDVIAVVEDVFGDVSGGVGDLGNTVTDTFDEASNAVTDTFDDVSNTLSDTFGGIFGREVENVELNSRDWKDFIANELDLEGCEVDAFKDVVDKGIELLKRQLGNLANQVITKIKQGKRGVEDESMMVNERGWVELVTKPIGLDSCQAGALKKFLTWFLRKGEQIGIPGFAQANVALQQMDKVDDVIAVVEDVFGDVSGGVGDLGNTVTDTFDEASNAVTDTFDDVSNTLSDTFGGIFGREVENVELNSRDWKDFIANELDLEGCEVDAFKDVVDKGIELLKRQLGNLANQVITKIKQGKRGVEDESMMVNERGWVELVTKPIGLDSCQAGALKKFLTWFLRKGEQLGIPGFAQANVALQQMDKVDDVIAVVEDVFGDVSGGVGDLGDTLTDTFDEASNAVTDTFEDVSNTLSDTFGGIFGREVENINLDSRDWKDMIASELELEGCEVDAFKDVIDQGISMLKEKLGYLADQVITKIKQGKRSLEDESLLVTDRGWVELAVKPLGLDECQAGALRKFLTWFLRKGELLGIPGFRQARLALEQMNKLDDVIDVVGGAITDVTSGAEGALGDVSSGIDDLGNNIKDTFKWPW